MGFFSPTTTPQIPPPHLLTRTFASPACVNQVPLTSARGCAFAGATASNAVKIVTKKPNLQAMEPPKKHACITANATCAMLYSLSCSQLRAEFSGARPGLDLFSKTARILRARDFPCDLQASGGSAMDDGQLIMSPPGQMLSRVTHGHQGRPHRSMVPCRGARLKSNTKGAIASKRIRPSGCSAKISPAKGCQPRAWQNAKLSGHQPSSANWT